MAKNKRSETEKKNVTIGNIKSNFAEKRRNIKQNYVNENGNADGIKSDKEYLKTFSTQKSLETRVRNIYEKTKVERTIIDEPKKEPSYLLEKELITQDGLFFDVLNNLGESGDTFHFALNEAQTFAQEEIKVKAVIRDFDKNVKVYSEQIKIDTAIAELYREAAKLQVKETKIIDGKKKRVTVNYPTISISQGQIGNTIYITVDATV